MRTLDFQRSSLPFVLRRLGDMVRQCDDAAEILSADAYRLEQMGESNAAAVTIPIDEVRRMARDLRAAEITLWSVGDLSVGAQP